MDILNDELLYTENLSKNFQGITAVDKVNFKINKNEIRALIGPNGAGKTTFVSLLCGRIRASKGKVFFNGSDISNLPVYKRISSGIGYSPDLIKHRTSDSSLCEGFKGYSSASIECSPSLKNSLHPRLYKVL